MDEKLEFKTYRLSGEVGDTSKVYSTTYAFDPPDQETLSHRGRLFIVLDIKSSVELDLELAGKLVRDALVDEYYSDKDGSPLKALEKAASKARERLVNLAFGEASNSEDIELDFNLAAAALWDNIVYLARLGEVLTSLVREGMVEEIGGGATENVTVASGMIKPRDWFVIGSKSFSTAVSDEKLLEALPVLINAAEELAPLDDPEGGSKFEVKNAYPSDFSMIVLDFSSPRDIAVSEEAVETLEEATKESEAGQAVDSEITDKSIVEESGKAPPFQESSSLQETSKKVSNLRNGLNKDKLSSLTEGLRSKLKGLPEKIMASTPSPIYVQDSKKTMDPYSKKSSKWFMIGIIVLSIIFFGSVFFTITKKRGRAHSEQVIELLNGAEENVDKAQELIDLNNTRAREFLSEAGSSIAEAEELAGTTTPEIQSLRADLRKTLDKVNKVTRLKDPEVFYDMTIQSTSSTPEAITGGSGSVFVADSNDGLLYRLRITEEDLPTVEKVNNDSLSNPRDVVPGTGRVFALTDSGLMDVGLESGEVEEADLELKAPFRDVSSMDVYADSLYFLSTSTNQIYRSSLIDGEFTDPIDWVGDEVNFEDASSLTIDGDIFILKRAAGEVLKFTRGNLVDWKLTQLDEPFKDPEVIYTTIDSNFLYILDSGNKRVVVVAKEGGLYQKQFVYEGDDKWNNLKDLWVDEESSSLYVLDGTRIYRIDL